MQKDYITSFHLQVTCDSSLLVISKIDVSENTRQRYRIAVSEVPTNDVNVTVKFYSSLTKLSKLILVTIKGDTTSNMQCPPSVSFATASTVGGYGRSRFLSYIVGEGSMWMLFYTLIVATIILILIMYHFYMKSKQPTPVIIQSPYIQSPQHSHSPPPYQHSPPYFQTTMNTTPGSYGPHKHNTPTRLFSVSQ